MQDYYQKMLNEIKDSTVVDARMTVYKDDYTDLDIPVITFEHPSGRVFQMEMLGDPEGNYSAHFEVYDISQDVRDD